ncbi:class I SAM-dependent methyltransferase [Nocardia sp. NPDC127526]|uniref:class I SAM-dependent methyltransferase n=1 Tax=Nocardia sp. NPDC127526 TaxID=3345393 RepID=UPI0036313D9F
MTSVRDRLLATIAGQLGNPHGLLGKGVALLLNRGNLAAITAAVEATDLTTGTTAADIGFGGAAGLPLLLNRVGVDGAVHGIEISQDMLARARSRFPGDIATGRLRLAAGSLTSLPLPDDGLDAAITVNTIYFVPDLPAAVAELVRVVRPGGRLVIGIGDPDAMAKMPFTPYGFTLRPVSEVVDALEAAGCTVERRDLPQKPIPHRLLIATPK